MTRAERDAIHRTLTAQSRPPGFPHCRPWSPVATMTRGGTNPSIPHDAAHRMPAPGGARRLPGRGLACGAKNGCVRITITGVQPEAPSKTGLSQNNDMISGTVHRWVRASEHANPEARMFFMQMQKNAQGEGKIGNYTYADVPSSYPGNAWELACSKRATRRSCRASVP